MAFNSKEDLFDAIHDLYRLHYDTDIKELASGYPQDRQALYVEAADLLSKSPDLLDAYLAQPDEHRELFEEELGRFDLPVDIDLSGASVRLTDSGSVLPRRELGSLTKDDLGKYRAIQCQLGEVTERKPRLKEGAFECQRCGAITRVPQSFSDSQEPHQCESCERQGPFKLDEDGSEWVDERKVKLESPPEASSSAELPAYLLDDLADPPGVQIQDKAGSRVTVIGKVECDQSSLFGRGQNEPVADEYFVPHAFVWGNNLTNEVDVDDHREEVYAAAGRDDAIDYFKMQIDPKLVVTEDWEQALEMAVPYLFAAPRINPVDGTTIRGDIHWLFVSDPGMNKSDFADRIKELSPKALKKDAEGMSSEVALTAAATQGSSFGDDSWSIQPGALPKANNGHLILDEIDKGPDGFLNGIHSPLEGEQTLRVEKAGQEANLATRCGFLALGNPSEGRFDPYEPIPEQVDLHPALMSRFDLICTMQDKPDEETDEEISSGMLDSIDESARVQYGELDAEDADSVSGEIDRDVMKAWVKLAREEINPLLTDAAKEELQAFYVEARQLNDGDSERPPTTARTLVGGVRIAMAFARCELSETVELRHAERAINLSKTIISKNFDPETGLFDADRTTETPSSQQERVNDIRGAIREGAGSVEEIVEVTPLDAEKAEHQLGKLLEKGKVYRPNTGELEVIE